MRQTNWPAALRALSERDRQALVSITGEMLATADYYDRNPEQQDAEHTASTWSYFVWRIRQVSGDWLRHEDGLAPAAPDDQSKDLGG